MLTCQKCGHNNRMGVMLCENCGIILHDDLPSPDPQPTKKLLVKKLLKFLSKLETKPFVDDQPTQRIAQDDLPPAPSNALNSDPSYFPPGSSLVLEIGEDEFRFDNPHKEIWLGRFGGEVPPPRDVMTVNLMAFGGFPLGVSRLHATIRASADAHVEIYDHASSNGTFINEQPLIPYEVYHLYHEDRLRLGQLLIKVKFILR